LHLLLIRHGQSFVNLDDWTDGYIDAGLTPLGQRQAQNLSEWLAAHVRLDALYTSTMARTLETAAYVAKAVGITPQTDDRLREFGNCYASGLAVPPEAMPIHYADFWGSARPHSPISSDGESWMLFRVRVSTFLDDLLERHTIQPDQKVAVICHGGVIDATYDYIFNVGPHRRVEVWTHNTGIVHWEYFPDTGREIWRLHGHDLVHHLADCNGDWLGSSPMLRGANRHEPQSKLETPGE
jgi:broad specificity phosphatase PhoE